MTHWVFGCNDIGNKQLTENEIAEWIVKIDRQCKESNLYDFFYFISNM